VHLSALACPVRNDCTGVVIVARMFATPKGIPLAKVSAKGMPAAKDTKDHKEEFYITGYQLNILNLYVKCVLDSIIFAFNRTTCY